MVNSPGAAAFLAEVVRYSIYDSHAHRPEQALEGLTDDLLSYCPVPELALDWDDEWRWPAIQTPRRLLVHLIAAAEHYRGGLVGESGAESNAEWSRANITPTAGSAEALIEQLNRSLSRLCDAVDSLTDSDLREVARETWDGMKMKGFVAIDGAFIHTAWHLGQIARLIDLHWPQTDGHELAPPTGPPGEYRYPCERDWDDLHLESRHDLILRIAKACHLDSPCHAAHMVVEGMTEPEMAWRPFPEIEDIWFCRATWVLCTHMWSPKIVYIDHALGERKLGYGEGDGEIAGSGWGETDPGEQLAALDRAHQWLVDHVSRATDEDLDRINPMHVETPLKSWQAAICMAQHDAWHAGQISLTRDLYRALWEAQGQ